MVAVCHHLYSREDTAQKSQVFQELFSEESTTECDLCHQLYAAFDSGIANGMNLYAFALGLRD